MKRLTASKSSATVSCFGCGYAQIAAAGPLCPGGVQIAHNLWLSSFLDRDPSRACSENQHWPLMCDTDSGGKQRHDIFLGQSPDSSYSFYRSPVNIFLTFYTLAFLSFSAQLFSSKDSLLPFSFCNNAVPGGGRKLV